MIEIKNRDGRVLYTAENATDVRAAVVEAARAGADLAGANLGRADLAGADLAGADLAGADLAGADLAGAYLAGAYLAGANLAGADLAGAYLGRAYLGGAYLAGAYLAGADLAGAYLAGAKGVNPYQTTPLYILADQVGKIRAYKLVTADGEGPFNGGITYRKGETVEVPDADTDPAVQCGAGVNVATLDWCINEWCDGYRILVVEFTAKDIAAIPHGSDGKFRVHRCRVVGEKNLADIGLAK